MKVDMGVCEKRLQMHTWRTMHGPSAKSPRTWEKGNPRSKEMLIRTKINTKPEKKLFHQLNISSM